jgi:hypothetical protein
LIPQLNMKNKHIASAINNLIDSSEQNLITMPCD